MRLLLLTNTVVNVTTVVTGTVFNVLLLLTDTMVYVITVVDWYCV